VSQPCEPWYSEGSNGRNLLEELPFGASVVDGGTSSGGGKTLPSSEDEVRGLLALLAQKDKYRHLRNKVNEYMNICAAWQVSYFTVTVQTSASMLDHTWALLTEDTLNQVTLLYSALLYSALLLQESRDLLTLRIRYKNKTQKFALYCLHPVLMQEAPDSTSGTQFTSFTCFTSTKVLPAVCLHPMLMLCDMSTGCTSAADAMLCIH
jgi:hypothetical protein